MTSARSRVFLTGHRGFIGSVVHARMPDVRVLATKGPRTAELVELLRGIDCVVHLAGRGGARFCRDHPKDALESNVILTHRLVDAARQAGVRHFVYASSIAVYGAARAPASPIAESESATPDDLYGGIKLACEEIVRGMPHTILRFANVYGFGTGANIDRGGFINNVCRSARTSGRINLTSATLGMDFVHVNDVAQTILACAGGDRSVDGVINVGSGRATSLLACARIIEAKLGASVEILVDEKPGYQTRYLDISKARDALGWRPATELPDGIGELLSRLA